jgi:hypothetical protein
MRVVRLTLSEFELEDGNIYPIDPPLEQEITLDEFQRLFEQSTDIIESIQTLRSDD